MTPGRATSVREGYLIWIPGSAFARSLKGQVKSGSISYAAWEAVRDAAIAVGDDSLKAMKVTQGRGFPYGFTDLRAFEEFKGKIVAALQRYGIPHDDVAVHGSSVIRKTPNDIDVAVLVDKARFDEIVRGIQASTDKTNILRQLRTEAAKGKIPSFLFERKLPGSSFGSEIHGSAGTMKVQVSLIEKGGSFDIGPYIKF